MSQDRRTTPDPFQEALLISLDQLSQTLEVMGKVITRLRYQIEDNPHLPQDGAEGDGQAQVH
jgi:hypothetical protein